jgi:hypothetical protein
MNRGNTDNEISVGAAFGSSYRGTCTPPTKYAIHETAIVSLRYFNLTIL